MVRAAILIIMCASGICAWSPLALAINWEGHEDWLEDTPPALELQRHFDGKVAPLPEIKKKRECQELEDVGEVPANPYEPVPTLCGERIREPDGD
jgi:hypothetical protein